MCVRSTGMIYGVCDGWCCTSMLSVAFLSQELYAVPVVPRRRRAGGGARLIAPFAPGRWLAGVAASRPPAGRRLGDPGSWMPGRRHSIAARIRRLPPWGRSLLQLLLALPHVADGYGVEYLVHILHEVGEILRAWASADLEGRGAVTDAIADGEDDDQGRRFRRLIGGDGRGDAGGADRSRSRSPAGSSAV